MGIGINLTAVIRREGASGSSSSWSCEGKSTGPSSTVTLIRFVQRLAAKVREPAFLAHVCLSVAITDLVLFEMSVSRQTVFAQIFFIYLERYIGVFVLSVVVCKTLDSRICPGSCLQKMT